MERNIWSLGGWVDCWKGIFDFWSLERNITSSPPRYHRPVGSLASSRQTIGNSWKGLWCRPPKIKMKVQRFLELSPQDRWPLGLRRSRHPPKDPPPCPPSRQLNLTSRPHTETLKGHTYVGLPQNTSNLNGVKWPTFENFYRPWIGWKGGDWTWVCGTTQFHRITSDSLDFFGISSSFKHFHCICKKHKYFWKEKR